MARNKTAGLEKLGDPELRGFALEGPPKEHRLVLVEPVFLRDGELASSSRIPRGDGWERLKAASVPERPTKPLLRSAAPMDRLARALRKLDIHARPIDSAGKFAVEVSPSELLKIAELDEVGFIFPNRTHFVRTSGSRG